MLADKKQGRRHIRAKSDPGHVAQIDLNAEGASFECHHVALIVDEAAMFGCGLVCQRDADLKPGMICRIKLGEVAPYKAEVVWVRVLDDQVVRLGCRFIE